MNTITPPQLPANLDLPALLGRLGKRCTGKTGCGRWLPIDAFAKNKSMKLGRTSTCRECQAAYRAANKDAIAERDAAYRAANKDAIAERQAAYYAANAARNDALTREELEAATSSKACPSCGETKSTRWFRRDRTKADGFGSRCNAYVIPRDKRYIRFGAEHEDWTRYDAMTHFVDLELYYCDVCFGPIDHVDHSWPLASLGGDVVENLRPLCQSCNTWKGSQHPYRWMIAAFREHGRDVEADFLERAYLAHKDEIDAAFEEGTATANAAAYDAAREIEEAA